MREELRQILSKCSIGSQSALLLPESQVSSGSSVSASQHGHDGEMGDAFTDAEKESDSVWRHGGSILPPHLYGVYDRLGVLTRSHERGDYGAGGSFVPFQAT